MSVIENQQPLTEVGFRARMFPGSRSLKHEWARSIEAYVDGVVRIRGEVADALHRIGTDRSLSDLGKDQQRHQVGLRAIARLRDGNAPSATALLNGLRRRLERLVQAASAGRAPETPNEIRLATMTAERIAGLSPAERMNFVRSMGQEAATFFALEHTPAALLGVSEEERGTLLTMARRAAAPEHAQEVDDLEHAIRQVEGLEGFAVEEFAKWTGLKQDPWSKEWSAPDYEPKR
jgi:hypothetical protein